jgi:transposase
MRGVHVRAHASAPTVQEVPGTEPSAGTAAAQDQQRLNAILDASPPLAALAGHIGSFTTIMCELRSHELEKWMAAVDTDDQPALHSFVRGLRRDQDAVTAGLTLPWNSGPVDGHVNRIKTIKRQMFGRAKHDLLR